MSFASVIARARNIVRKPPGYLLDRAVREIGAELDRWQAPRRERRFQRGELMAIAKTSTVDELWNLLRDRPYPAATISVLPATLDAFEPGESARVVAAADLACGRQVELLGMGRTALGTPIDWMRDYRAGMRWDAEFARSIDYVNRDRPSDVKIPWEISRLQWLIPAGQAYLLSGDERYAQAVRDVIDEWIIANPIAYTVNWASTMEAAIRIVTWTWFFHVFARSAAWADDAFRLRFLSALYLHGDFTRRHIEKADINGNHYTADLAGLVFAGLFFGDVGDATRWAQLGWSALVSEICRQVFPDGVDYEASSAYHRFVFELFLWPALYRRSLGLGIPREYSERLRLMARFTATYMRCDGSSPLWGDADDARVLPFGGQPTGDHRYIVGLAAAAFGDAELASWHGGPCSELLWSLGPGSVAALSERPRTAPQSAAFPNGGCYIMRHGTTHVFIDCGPVGLAGRGGHGHSDALSFEAWLDGAPLLVDCGSYVYTASFEQRNKFRSTSCHNTPMIDRQEINRLIAPHNLWSLCDDAQPRCTTWCSDAYEDLFAGTHRGYERLGVQVRRTIRFVKALGSLEVVDWLSGSGCHEVLIPFHLAPGVTVEQGGKLIRLRSAGCVFEVTGQGADWTVAVEPCSISPSYGVALPSQRLVWNRTGPLPAELRVAIQPCRGGSTMSR